MAEIIQMQSNWKSKWNLYWRNICQKLMIPYAFLVLTLGNLIFRFVYLLPFVNRKRKRFQKEVKPIFYFKTWKSFIVMGVIGTFFVFLVTNYLVTILRALLPFIIQNSMQLLPYMLGKSTLIPFDTSSLLLSSLWNYQVFYLSPIFAIPLFLFLSVIAWKSAWINFEQFRDYNHNEHGDDKFLSFSEVKRQYVKIPDKTVRYEGMAGLPVAHVVYSHTLQGQSLASKMKFRNKFFVQHLFYCEKVLGITKKVTGAYFIDTETINMLITGMTRSGKGETFVNPMIDINSRASIPSSIVVSDPKGELYQSSYETLCKRGFDVEVLSFQDMDWSMSYNPLALAIESAKKGYYEKTQTRINAVAEAIYRKSKEGEGNAKYWEDTSISLFNAIAMALIDRANEAFKGGETDAWETITVRNIAKFLTDLGSETVLLDSQGNLFEESDEKRPTERKSKLTFYFDELRKLNAITFSKFREMADINFRSSDFASEETKGNVYSSMMSGINLFLQDNIAKLTSKNSIDLESVGNPRRLSIRFRSSTMQGVHNPFAHLGAKVSIYERGSRMGKRVGKPLVRNQSAIIDGEGYLNVVIHPKLPNAYRIIIDLSDNQLVIDGKKQYQKSTRGRIIKNPYTNQAIFDQMNFKIVSKPKGLLMDETNIEMVYSEKPKALFLVTPPHRDEYNAIVSLLIDQIFNANYEVALSADRKTTNRIQFILDEFANIPKIPAMDTKLSIGLGQNIQFMIFVQNLEQIENVYGKEASKTIINNCSLNVLIKTKSEDTAKAYSKSLGTKTITKREKSGNVVDEANPNVRFSTKDQPLMTENQLLNLEAGEAVVIRGVKEKDNLGRKVTPDPIFVAGRLEMPYRYMFLNEEFNQKMTLADIPVTSPHRNLNLQEIAVPANSTLVNLREWKKALLNHEEAYLSGRKQESKHSA